MDHAHTHIALELGGLILSGIIIGAFFGGGLAAGYKVIDKNRDLPAWEDALFIGGAHLLAIIAAAYFGRFVEPDLKEIGARMAPAVAALGALVGPQAWPGILARSKTLLDRKLKDA